ncbi:MAG TPA: VOC family protein [Cellulomonas sp.]
MPAALVPHLNFHGDARQALALYATVLDGDVTIRTYGDLGMPATLPDADKVVFGQVVGAGGVTIAAYDVPGATDGTPQHGTTRRENGVTITDQPYFLAVSVSTLDEASGYWDALTADGAVIEPLAASAWSAGFGMITDRFGVTWAISVADVPSTQV